ncbi:fatty acid CoA ligase family protein [Pelagicoccus sp. SDUM812002]|uniref:fatty acid CoA ligase family protein n=1 Tax=Pelagicoccus sp. SDUM812002 TaxID=3041266 RepID=UPI00280C8805|nr:fatty acid CoA ligase family protein [Pelagicoccus sp. SDUM812002]MDQ8184917.1 fatty acid CoA ligase family protein [Pelagicoccus sp. SDUM812002]
MMIANVSRFLDEKAQSQPEIPALMVPRGRTADGAIDYLSLTFRELAAEQNEWARRFRAKGMGKGSRVLLMVKPGLPLIAICFALFKIGAVPVVIDPGMGLKSFLNCVRRSKPEYLVGISLAIWVSRVFRKSFRSVKAKTKVGGPLDRVAESFKEVSAESTLRDDLAAVLFTSGSTGAPKGVCYEHGMFEAQVEAIRAQYQIQPGEVDLPMLPIFALFNPALGMTTVVPEINPSKPATVDPRKIVQAIQQCGVTNSFGSPALWAKIGVYCDSHDIELPSLKRILMAGAPVPPPLMKQYQRILPNGHVHSPYGATEVLPVSSVVDEEVLQIAAERSARGEGTCVGKILPGVEARILPLKEGAMDASDLANALPNGEIGEIVVTGPSVTKAYDQLPEATRLSKIEESERVWHRIGDLGYLDTDGFLWFCGRKMERVETDEGIFYSDRCEGVVNVHPKVFRSALIRFEEVGGVVPALVVEPFSDVYPNDKFEETALLDEVRELAAACHVTQGIRHFFLHKGFPVDVRHNAKIHRLTLAKEFAGKR